MSARRAERKASPLFEIALVFLRLGRVAYSIANANQCICDQLQNFAYPITFDRICITVREPTK
jgi:hypothetical protein